jgi:hypothetical protein
MNTLLTLTALAIPVGLLVGIHLEDYYRARKIAKAEAAAEARREAILTAAIENAIINAARRRQAELQAAARRKASEDFIEAYYSPPKPIVKT